MVLLPRLVLLPLLRLEQRLLPSGGCGLLPWALLLSA